MKLTDIYVRRDVLAAPHIRNQNTLLIRRGKLLFLNRKQHYQKV